jgi:peptide/nickel transport system permease protein
MYFAPGNPAAILLRYKNPTGGLHPETVALYAEKLGTDKGFFAQFADWIGSILHGDFGLSFKTGVPVLQEFADRLGCTASLMIFASVLALVIGVGLGMASALHDNRLIDKVARLFVVCNMSTPDFWLALLFIWIFSVKLNWLPSFGLNGFSSLILPGVVLGLSYCGSFVRISKVCMLDSLASCYVMTARAKGLSESTILRRHVLKNILLPIITLCGMNITALIGGSVIIERIFGLPGLGNYLITAISVKDFPVILGFVFIFGVMIIAVNLLVDLSYTLIDPRVRQAIREK